MLKQNSPSNMCFLVKKVHIPIDEAFKTSTFTQKPPSTTVQGTRICCQGGGSPNNSRISGAKICRLKPRRWTRCGSTTSWLDGVGGAAVEEGHEAWKGFFVGFVFFGRFGGVAGGFLKRVILLEESAGMGSFEVGKM